MAINKDEITQKAADVGKGLLGMAAGATASPLGDLVKEGISALKEAAGKMVSDMVEKAKSKAEEEGKKAAEKAKETTDKEDPTNAEESTNTTTQSNSSSSTQNTPVDEQEKEEEEKAEETAAEAAENEEEPTSPAEEEDNKNSKGIFVQEDPSLDLPDIVVAVNNPGPDETGEGEGEETEQQQTKTIGILTPLIKIGGSVIPSDSISSFVLKGGKFPSLEFAFSDNFNIVETFDKPRPDNNKVQLQIIPQFDNIYKKINMTFWITSYYKEGVTLNVRAIYFVPGLYDIKMKAYGELSTYDFFKTVAGDLHLGFASNITSTDDKRWIYIPNKRYLDALDNEASFGGNETQVLDWWVDWWNYLNLADMKERTTSIDQNITIWSMPTQKAEVDSSYTSTPIETEAFITNKSDLSNLQLYTQKYTSDFYPQIETDKVIEYYNMITLQQDTCELMDKDIKNDTKFSYEYAGECLREFNYLKSKAINTIWKNKILSSPVVVELNQPCLGLMKGGKVNFYWYSVGQFTNDTKDTDIQTNIPIDENIVEEESLIDDNEPRMVLDKQISGQYYIYDASIEYEFDNGNYNWKHILTLIRPEDQKDYFDWSAIKIEET